MILVAGGTGRLGTLLVDRLVARGGGVRVLTRELARAKHLGGGVEIVAGDVRDVDSVTRAMADVDTVVSAVHGFAGARVSPASVDRQGNFNLVDAATRVGADFVLVSIVGAAADSPMELLRAKYEAEEHLRRSGLEWTIVRATAFIETWAMVMGEPLRAKGKTLVFGRGENPINFVSVHDVAAVVERAAVDSALRGRVLELGGANATFNQVAAMLLETVGSGSVRHIPRPMLRAMGIVMSAVNPELARHARAAVVMDTRDMTFDPSAARRAFPELPDTDLRAALTRYFGG